MAIRQRSYVAPVYREDPWSTEKYTSFEYTPFSSAGFMPWVHSILDFICSKEGLAEDLPEYMNKYIALLESNLDSWNHHNQAPLSISF